jgi:hypothetical protein
MATVDGLLRARIAQFALVKTSSFCFMNSPEKETNPRVFLLILL